MAGRRGVAWARTACLLLLVAGCAQAAGGATLPPSDPSPVAADRLVLQVQRVGGFPPVGVSEAALPVVSVYGDGRVITEGPVPAVHPGPALPNVQVRRIGPDAVRALVDRALAAGVRDTADLGRPGVADAPTTRFTVVTGSRTYVRDVYALTEAAGASSDPRVSPHVTPEQAAARAALLDLSAALTDLDGTLGAGVVGDSRPYRGDAVAAVVTPWQPRVGDPAQPQRAWPGPGLPGERLGERTGLTCVSATGDAARALLDAAGSANALTPWTSADGTPWSVAFRPLLPDESGCADLTS